MALVDDGKLTDMILGFLQDQRPVYNTIIDRYYEGRAINFFFGRRITIPTSSMPSIEVQVTGVEFGWHACRVQEETASVEIDITTDQGNPEMAPRLEFLLVELTARILTSPPHLMPRLPRSRHHLYDSLPTGVQYGKIVDPQMRVATISWRGKQLEYLANRLFQPAMQIGQPLDFPIA